MTVVPLSLMCSFCASTFYLQAAGCRMMGPAHPEAAGPHAGSGHVTSSRGRVGTAPSPQHTALLSRQSLNRPLSPPAAPPPPMPAPPPPPPPTAQLVRSTSGFAAVAQFDTATSQTFARQASLWEQLSASGSILSLGSMSEYLHPPPAPRRAPPPPPSISILPPPPDPASPVQPCPEAFYLLPCMVGLGLAFEGKLCMVTASISGKCSKPCMMRARLSLSQVTDAVLLVLARAGHIA